MMETESQTNRVLEHLSQGRTLTALQALALFGCFRLAARIADIKRKGFDVKSEMVQVGAKKKKVAQYSIDIV